ALIGVFQGEVHALPARATDILEKAEAGDVARHIQDVVIVGGAEDTGAPIETTGRLRDSELAPQPRLEAARNHLPQMGVRDDEIGYEASVPRIGAAELERRRGAVRF